MAKESLHDRASRRAAGKQLSNRLSEYRALQEAIFNALEGYLETGAEVLDLCSSYGIAVNALVAAGKISKLELIDAKYNRRGDNERKVVEAILERLGIPRKVTLNGTLLRPDTRLSPSPNVVLSDTGLALPEKNRVQSLVGQPSTPQTLRAGHIPNAVITFQDVLEMLSGNTARRLFVFESPFHGTHMRPEEMTGHIEASMKGGNTGWTISSRRDSTVKGFPFHEAVLTYSPST